MITIKTKLNSGIYKSSGGGEVVTHYEYTAGPRNLLNAIEQLCQHRAEMTRSYGNIGCGRTWLEIDGQVIHPYDLDEVARDDQEFFKGSGCSMASMKTRTEKARDLLAEVAAGYDINKYDLDWEEVVA